MEIGKLILQFIETQGMMAFVVLAFAYFMHQQNNNIKGLIANAKAESAQQDKIITQNGLNLAQSQRNRESIDDNTGEVEDLKTLMADLIKVMTQQGNDKKTMIKDGIASIEKNTEGVNVMKGNFEDLEKAVQLAIDTMNNISKSGIDLSESAKQDIIDSISDGLKPTIRECLYEAIASAKETPKPKLKIVKPEKETP